MNTLQEHYLKEVKPKLQEKLKIKNPMAIPGLVKVVVNMGVKDAISDKKNIDKASQILVQITGQKPKVNKAKKSIATFKLRQGEPIGLMVTLRGKRMYDFFEKVVKVILPRLRDFHGVKSNAFDGRGNYALGFAEAAVFPEIDPGKIDKIQGLEVIVVTSAKDNEAGYALLEALGMPFQKGGAKS